MLMTKNNVLFNALSDAKVLAGKLPVNTRNKALDDLLKIDPKDATAFRKAITDNAAFWGTYDGFMTIPLGPTTWTSTVTSTVTFGRYGQSNPVPNYLDSDQFLDPADVGNSFTILHQLAAKQRVMLGLETANEDVLVGILANNPDECRAYLAERPALGDLTRIKGWKANEVVPDIKIPFAIPPLKNTSTDVLTDQAIEDIRKRASELLLLKLTAKSDDQSLLTSIVTSLVKPSLDAALKAFNFPASGIEFLNPPLAPEVSQAMTTRIGELKKVTAKSGFETYARTLSNEDVLALKTTVLEEMDLEAFKAALPADYRDFLVDLGQMNWAKSLLGARYLSAYLPTQAKASLVEAINNATNPDLMKDELEKLTGIHDYVNQTVTEGTLNSIRRSMIQGIISQATADTDRKGVDGIVQATDADALKEGLKKLGITQLDWVKESDLSTMQQSARSRIFYYQIANTSQLGADVHPQLLIAFNQLSSEKQLQILNKRDELHHLLKAQDVDTVKHYLGKNIDVVLASAIVKENQVHVLFNSIHNYKIANILANFKPPTPPVTLDAVKVNAINDFLKLNADAVVFTDVVRYKLFIGSIRNLCAAAVDEASFNAAFNLNADGSAFVAPTPVKDEIKTQQANNVGLFAEYSKAENADYTKLFDVLLSIKKRI